MCRARSICSAFRLLRFGSGYRYRTWCSLRVDRSRGYAASGLRETSQTSARIHHHAAGACAWHRIRIAAVHDEIVSIDGARTTSELEAKSVLHSVDEGTAVEMIVSRAGVVRVMSLTAATEPRVKITLRATDWSVLRERWLQKPYRG